MAHGTCTVNGCNQPQLARGWCSTHYHRWWRHGNLGPAWNRRPGPDAERFWARVQKRDSGCWEWAAGQSYGYGVFYPAGSAGIPVRAHRFSWELANGPIPDDSVRSPSLRQPAVCSTRPPVPRHPR
jgi:hypothetical protein